MIDLESNSIWTFRNLGNNENWFHGSLFSVTKQINLIIFDSVTYAMISFYITILALSRLVSY